MAWVVEMGTLAMVARPMVVAAASSAEKPPMGRRWSVMREPIGELLEFVVELFVFGEEIERERLRPRLDGASGYAAMTLWGFI